MEGLCASGEPALLQEIGHFYCGVGEHWNRLHRSCEIASLETVKSCLDTALVWGGPAWTGG